MSLQYDPSYSERFVLAVFLEAVHNYRILSIMLYVKKCSFEDDGVCLIQTEE